MRAKKRLLGLTSLGHIHDLHALYDPSGESGTIFRDIARIGNVSMLLRAGEIRSVVWGADSIKRTPSNSDEAKGTANDM